MPESKIFFGLNEDGDVVATKEEPFDVAFFRDGSWTRSGSAGDVFRLNSISEEEAMLRTSGVMPTFSR